MVKHPLPVRQPFTLPVCEAAFDKERTDAANVLIPLGCAAEKDQEERRQVKWKNVGDFYAASLKRARRREEIHTTTPG